MLKKHGRWRKHGRVFVADGEFGWINSHAQVPTPVRLADRLRVFFATRPRPGFSLPAYVDLDLHEPSKVLGLSSKPLLEPGGPGTFDEHGIMPSCVVWHGSLLYLFYSGWSRGRSVPYTNATGLAYSRDGGNTFEKAASGPVLARGPNDPYSATSPFIIDAGEHWHMWYTSGTDWPIVNGKYEHVYDIKLAVSTDLIHWETQKDPAIPQGDSLEAVARPTVWYDGKIYHMWYSVRGSCDFRGGSDAYRLGYAQSSDGLSWRRRDTLCTLEAGNSGWDSGMVAYPYIVDLPWGLALFYNGNGFGVEGFGYAAWESDRDRST